MEILNYITEENIKYDILVLNSKADFNRMKMLLQKSIINGVEINYSIKSDELEMIANTQVKYLSIRESVTSIDIKFVNSILSLEYLIITTKYVYGNIDLSLLCKLQYITYDATNVKIYNINKANELKELVVYNCKSDSFTCINKIKRIAIRDSKIKSLDFVESCATIESVEIINSPNIESLSNLKASADKIKSLRIERCKISDYSLLYHLVNLKDLYIIKSTPILDTSLFNNLKKLQYGYIDIDILSGDVTKLLELPIIFKNYKHFNQKNNLRIKVIKDDGNYLVRNNKILYKLNEN